MEIIIRSIYFAFDFFPIGETNMNNGYDAVFIRCVQR